MGAGYPCAGQRIDISELFGIIIIFVLCGTLGAVLETGSIFIFKMKKKIKNQKPNIYHEFWDRGQMKSCTIPT